MDGYRVTPPGWIRHHAISLPDWPVLVDVNVMDQERVIIGSGIRSSKLLAATEVLASLPGAEVMALTKAD